MKYCIINTGRAEKMGFSTATHRTFDGGNKMVINENELARLDVGGSQSENGTGWELLSLSEVENIIKKHKKK